jgi:hypothetical protein
MFKKGLRARTFRVANSPLRCAAHGSSKGGGYRATAPILPVSPQYVAVCRWGYETLQRETCYIFSH